MINRQQFIKKAKAICDEATEERNEKGIAFLEQRARESGESLGLVGEFEVVRKVVVPSLRREIKRLEQIGLPREEAYEVEAMWQALRIVLHEVAAEGMFAWRSAKLLPAFRNRAIPFQLQSCVVN